MIKANELRLGNLILVQNQQVEVTAIEDDGILDTTAFFAFGMGCCGCSCEEADPAPLTEEWLRNFGFKISPIYRKGYFELEYGHFSKCYQYRQGEVLYNIQFVHQLQNLYFALNGEELTIKPW